MSRVSLKSNASGTGTFTIESPNSNTDRTITIPDYSGTLAVDGPAFSAWLGAEQNPSDNSWTKVRFNVKEFDTASCYDNTTNFRFIPNIAGYYYVNWHIMIASSSVLTEATSILRKNDEYYRYGSKFTLGSGFTIFGSPGGTLVYMNGSTDYLEVWAVSQSSGTRQFVGGATYNTYFQGYLVRRA